MANKSTEMGLELKKRALAIPYHTLTSKNDFRAILSPVLKILENFIICLDKSKIKCYNFPAFKNERSKKMKMQTEFERMKETLEDAVRAAIAKDFNNKLKKMAIKEGTLVLNFEMLFPEILSYVESKFSAEALEALDRIIVRHTKYDWEKALKSEYYLLRDNNTEPNAEVIKEALEALKIDITTDAELLEEVIDWLANYLASTRGKNITKQDAIEAMQVALQGEGKHLGVLAIIEFCIAAKYFRWFCFKTKDVVFAVIDSYTERGESLIPKTKAYNAKKRAELERKS